MRLKIILLLKKFLKGKLWSIILTIKERLLFIIHPVKYRAIKQQLLTKLSSDTIFLIGTPQHGNVGDQAIVMATFNFLSKYGFSNIYEISSSEYYLYKRLLKHYGKNHLFCLHGGGNMGIEYFANEAKRRDIIRSFPNNKIIIFPQTIDYGTTSEGLLELEKSIQLYSRHSCLTIFARETYSYAKMKEYYSNNTIYLVPDIVLSWKPDLPNVTRSATLVCLRHDKESIFTADSRRLLYSRIQEICHDVGITDTWTAQVVDADSRPKYVLGKLKEFRAARLVITDRLHGMIFAAITETPCIALPNYNHKVKYEYEWIKDLPYVTLLENPDQLVPTIKYFSDNICNKIYNFHGFDSHFQSLYDALKEDS